MAAPIVQTLYNRGLKSPQEVRDFLREGEDKANPFRLKGINEAVARLRQALRSAEPIAVYGDFDVDGLAATALLVETLRSLGGCVIPYVPRRISEGYGLNPDGLTHLAQQRVKLVVTVDCGIRSCNEVALAAALGMEVIITDHHSVPQELPSALAIVNPKQEGCPYPFKELSGAALAYRLAQGLLRVQGQVRIGRQEWLPEEEELLDMVALGAVADLVPLWGENRQLVRAGLARLNERPRPGLYALAQQAGLTPGAITSQSISFQLAPRLNAAGRLDRPEVSLELLLTKDPGRAGTIAAQLEEMNRKRRSLTGELLKRALEEVEARRMDEDNFIFLGGRDYFSGVSGLVAARLVELFYRPALVLEVGEELSRGSARGIPEFNLVAALEGCQEYLTRFGGHAMAAGVTLPSENVGKLEEALKAIADQELSGQTLMPALSIDAELALEKLTPEIFPALEELAPFGQGNPEPLFLARDVKVREGRQVGGAHLRLSLASAGVVWSAIAFHQGHWAENLPPRIALVYSLQMNRWQGQEVLELRVQDLRPAGKGW